MAHTTHKTLPPFAEGFPTPPDCVLDSFSRTENSQKAMPKVAPVQTPPSPISPAQKTLLGFGSPATYQTHDALLYPDNDQEQSQTTQTPLFGDAEASSQSDSDNAPTPPSHSPPLDLSLSTNLGSIIGPSVYIEHSPKGVWQYYSDRMAELDKIRECRSVLPVPVKSTAAKRDATTTRQLQSLLSARHAHPIRPTGVAKIKAPVKSTPKSPKSRGIKTSSPAPAVLPAKRTPKSSTPQDFNDFHSPSAQSSKHKRAPPTKKTFTNDEAWRTFEDFCPPVSSLDTVEKPLKAGWGKSSPMDIKDDTDYGELHPAEAAVAAELRLHPVQYLANKRRIFTERVKRMKEQQSFTKTAAQNVCNIDVNKVSKLWEAFSKVGWFEEHWFEQYM